MVNQVPNLSALAPPSLASIILDARGTGM